MVKHGKTERQGTRTQKKARIFLFCFNNYYCFNWFNSCLSFFMTNINIYIHFLGEVVGAENMTYSK